MSLRLCFLSFLCGVNFIGCSSLVKKTENPIIVKTMTFPVERVQLWQALTEEKDLSLWWHDGVRLEPKLGGQFHEPWGKDQLATGRVVDIDIDVMIEFSWREKSWQPGEETICRFELTENGEETTLKIIHRGWESFPSNNRAQLLRGFNQGWDSILDKLRDFLVPTFSEI